MYDEEEKDIDREIFRMVRERLHVKNETLMSSDNDLHYSHGGSWSHIDAATGDRNVGTFAEASAEASISVQRILDNDARIIPEFVEEMSEKMHGKMATSVYQLVGEAAESVGNHVAMPPTDHLSPEDETRAVEDGLMAIFERIEFGVDKFGAPSAPQLHLHPSNTRLIKVLTATPSDESQRRMDELMRHKEADAVWKEAQRLSRYRRE